MHNYSSHIITADHLLNSRKLTLMKIYFSRLSQFYYFLITVVFALAFTSCNEDEPIIVENDLVEDLGLYELLPESIALMPYLGKEAVVFVDSLGNREEFDINEFNLSIIEDLEIYNFDVVELGDTVIYRFDTEVKNFVLENNSLNECFDLELSVHPRFMNTAAGYVSDILSIAKPSKVPGENITYNLFSERISARNDPFPFSNERASSMEIFGRTFQDVIYSSAAPFEVSFLIYNHEFGIISFNDTTGKTWRFEEFK